MNKIKLPRDGAEYAHFTFSPADFASSVVLEAEIEGQWYQLDRSNTLPRLLLRGPDSPAGGTGVLVSQDGPIRVRINSTPEIIVRGAGYVSLVS